MPLSIPGIPPQYKLAAIIGLFLLGVLVGWQVNGLRMQAKIDNLKLNVQNNTIDGLEDTIDTERESVDISNEVGSGFQETKEKIVYVDRIVEKKVIEYVQNDNATVCELDPEWVRIDSYAARGLPTDGSTTIGADDSTAGGFTSTDLLPVLTERSRICRYEIGRLKALQEYITKQQKLLNK